MSRKHLLALYSNTSQLDEPVYKSFAEVSADNESTVLYWNDFGLSRTKVDPELGVVPEFPEIPSERTRFRKIWLDSRVTSIIDVLNFIGSNRPTFVLVNDVALNNKLAVAAYCRIKGIQVAFRSDKNDISTLTPGRRASVLERLVYGAAFNVLCEVGELTRIYYGWARKHVLFPYASDTVKFGSGGNAAAARARAALDIPQSAKVLLSVMKFNAREGAMETLEIYAQLSKKTAPFHVIFVGSGPLEREMKERAVELGLTDRVIFAGYVPYRDLQHYFWAADIFLHFARCEPWGVSPLDALAAGLSLVTSDRVGSGVEILGATPGCSHFVVPFDRPDQAVLRLAELLDDASSGDCFIAARTLLMSRYSVEATALRFDAAL